MDQQTSRPEHNCTMRCMQNIWIDALLFGSLWLYERAYFVLFCVIWERELFIYAIEKDLNEINVWLREGGKKINGQIEIERRKQIDSSPISIILFSPSSFHIHSLHLIVIESRNSHDPHHAHSPFSFELTFFRWHLRHVLFVPNVWALNEFRV